MFFLILVGFWSFFIEPRIIQTEKIYLEIKNLPSPFKELKIVQLSDLHSKNFGPKEKKVLKEIAKLNPDFIFITGDLVDWATTDFDSCQEFWQKLSQSRKGKIFAIYGNHEHRNKKFKNLNNILKESGIEVLNNETIEIEKNGKFIYLIGVDDPHLGFDNFQKATQGLTENNPKILLAHSPEIFSKVKGKVDLVLTGHTHGCQINLPILCRFILPVDYYSQYKKGLFQEDSTYLYVNRGVGETFLPLRFNSFSEIALIELK